MKMPGTAAERIPGKLESSSRIAPGEMERIEQKLSDLANERDEAQAELPRIEAQLESIDAQKQAALAACFKVQG